VGRRDRIIELGAIIKELRSKLKVYEQELDRLLDPSENGVSDYAERNSPDSIWNRTLAYLEADPKQAFSAPTIATALQVANVNTIRGTLSRLAAVGKISKAGRGEYQARQEDPTADIHDPFAE
jgi:hypothetical protein